MRTVSFEKAQATLPDLLHLVAEGDEIIIAENGEPKAKLSAVPSRKRVRPQAGSLPGKIWMSPDFDGPLDDFKDYSP
jgi:antitoxin (DNA-binding transcriptional repressor) of toxin-antitoxin stability system